MEKTFKTQEIVEYSKALEDFINKDIELDAQAVWDIEDNAEVFKKIADKFDKHRTELLQPLVDKNAFTNNENGQLLVDTKYQDEFVEACSKIDEYLATENTVDIKTINKSALPSKISVKDLRAIKFMLADEN